ncbi:MAG: AHH domain-containing protein, partial [Bacillota bacterium]|nr:AHH domain-containing protein [Bacillota bacterium]
SSYIDYRNPGTVNLYQYVQGNPLRYVDYDGHECIEEKSYMDRSLEMVVMGSYSDEFTWLGLGMQMVLGLTGLDAPMDFRDLTADLTVNRDIKSPEWWGIIIADMAAFFPLVGVAKYADELGAGLKGLIKHVDDFIAGGKRTANVLDALSDVARRGRAKTDDIARAINNLVDGAKRRLHSIENTGDIGENVTDAAKHWDDMIEGGSTTKPNQVHHYATDKNKTYTQAFKDITDKYGLDLDADWNKDLLPHQGRHPNAYHDFVLDEMRNIDNIANGNKDIFLDLYESEIKSIIRDNPDMLYSNYWKGIKE